MAKDVTNHAYVMKTPLKVWEARVREIRLAEHAEVPGDKSAEAPHPFTHALLMLLFLSSTSSLTTSIINDKHSPEL